jgi:hypothetical protein
MNPYLAAKAELRNLRKQEAAIKQRIKAIEKTVVLLEPVYSDKGEDVWDRLERLAGCDSGLTRRVRGLFDANPLHLFSPVEVRNLLILDGFDATGRSNFLSEVHQTLRRLVVRGDVEECVTASGKQYRGVQAARSSCAPPVANE